MDDSQQCLRCGASSWWTEGTCVRCGTTLAVDLRLLAVPTDPRVRYELTKKLAELGGLNVDLTAQFKSRTPVLAHNVTRALAGEVAKILAAANLEFEILPLAAEAAPVESGGSGLGRVVLLSVTAALALGAGAGWYVWKNFAGGLEPSTRAFAKTFASPLTQEEPVSLKDAVESVVSVRCSRSLGSGFFVAPHTIVTNHHVLCENGEAPRVVQPSGREGSARVVARDPKRDLAVLSVELEGRPLSLADAASIEVGSQVAIIGSPKGLDFSVHRGNLSFVGRATGGVGYLQIDSAINPGNSGGPVLDARGRVIGVVTARMRDTEGIGFAVPVNYLVSGASPLWKDGPTDILGSEWQAFDERTRSSEGAALTGPSPTPGSTDLEVPEKIDALLVGARWVVFDRLRTPELRVVVVTTDPQAEDRRWLFELKVRDERVCDMLRTRTFAWARLEASDPNVSPELARQLVAKHLDKQLYVGVMGAQWSSCPAAYSHDVSELALELPGAPAHYNRIGIRWR